MMGRDCGKAVDSFGEMRKCWRMSLLLHKGQKNTEGEMGRDTAGGLGDPGGFHRLEPWMGRATQLDSGLGAPGCLHS